MRKKTRVMPGDLVRPKSIVAPRLGPNDEVVYFRQNLWTEGYESFAETQDIIFDDITGLVCTVVAVCGKLDVLLLVDGRLGWYFNPRSWLEVVAR